MYSGSIYPMVPLTSVNTLLSSMPNIFANPKSESLGSKFSVNRMFVSCKQSVAFFRFLIIIKKKLELMNDLYIYLDISMNNASVDVMMKIS